MANHQHHWRSCFEPLCTHNFHFSHSPGSGAPDESSSSGRNQKWDQGPIGENILRSGTQAASVNRIKTKFLIPVLGRGVKWKSFSHVRLFATPWTIVHGILQARILEWVAFPFSRGSSQPRDQTQVSRIASVFFTSWATREAQEHWSG